MTARYRRPERIVGHSETIQPGRNVGDPYLCFLLPSRKETQRLRQIGCRWHHGFNFGGVPWARLIRHAHDDTLDVILVSVEMLVRVNLRCEVAGGGGFRAPCAEVPILDATTPG